MSGPGGRIAIVGLACRYPGASSPEELWQNALAGRRAFRRIPPERLRLEDYRNGAVPASDGLDCTEAALLDGWEFDRLAFRVAGSTHRATDPVHWLALETAAEALRAAGFPAGRGLRRERAGVLVGNSLTGETSRAQLLRLRWPYVRRVVAAALETEGWSAERRGAFLATLEEGYKEPFEPPGEESLAGGLSNTIAGRICNHFDLGGGGYTVDGACASSLLAVANACSALAAGDLDVALAGGVDLSLDPFELVGFSRTGALSTGEMWVYDRRSQGFLPGEGCGLAVLMRLDDAVARNRPVLATLAGWGISSDGAGGVTRPEAEGQLRALRAAYRRAGFGPETVGYFEGHGTGTAVGDATELDALDRLLREGDHPPAEPVAVGSVKAVIGHTKAAAGIAGLIKAVTAARTGVVPATVGCEQAHPRFGGDGDGPAAVRPVERAESWRPGPRRAGVSAMGFGGINCHVVVEVDGDAPAAGSPDRPLPDLEELLDRTRQDAELLLLSAEDTAALARRLTETAERARGLSRAQLTDLAAELASAGPAGAFRCAVVAARPAEAADALNRAAGALDRPLERPFRGDGFWLGRADPNRREPVVGLLFTGQGTSRSGEEGDWTRRFPEAEAIRCRSADLGADLSPGPGPSPDGTGTVQPRVVVASLMAVALLDRLGVQARVAVGHSLGELSALCWAGALEPDALVRLALARGQAIASLETPPGAMASLSCPRGAAEELVRGTSAVLAALNGPDRVVISGPEPAIRERIAEARKRGIAASLLPVSHAFHSPAMAGAAAAVEEAVRRERPASRVPGRAVVSTVTGEALAPGVDLSALLRNQLTAPVLFAGALEAAHRTVGGVDLWLEAGPGRALAELAVRCGPVPAEGMEAGGSGVAGLLRAAGALFCAGAPIDPGALFRDRFTRPLPREHRFLANPCERAPTTGAGAGRPPAPGPGRRPGQAVGAEAPTDTVSGTDAGGSADADPVEVIRHLVAARAELPPESLGDGDRMLSDLHLNSISVGQLVVAAARRLGVAPPAAPTDFADASVAEIGAALRELGSEETPAEDPFPDGIAPWVRAFRVELEERPAPAAPARSPAAPPRIFAPGGVAGARRLRKLLDAEAPPAGTLVWLPPELDEAALETLLDAVRAALADAGYAAGGGPGRFVLVHSGAGGAFARSLHLERRRGEVLVVQVPAEDPEAARWVAAELSFGGGPGYREAVYDARGTRRVPILRPDAPGPGREDGAQGLGSDDVLLVTGGGRGIGAECALALARHTGCALALVGRSQPESSEELAGNLERLAAAGVRHAYRAADVADRRSTRAAVVALEEGLGPVTAILHAAGVNRPRLLARLDLDILEETLAPKVKGLEHVLAALDPHRLRLLVGFGSIIARTGMPGEAHYALANEALALAVERFGRRHPGCRCLAVEWSVWSGVGMGERLAGGEAMRRRGITPIPPDRGVAHLLELLEAPPGASPTVVVTGRFGDPPTVETDPRELPFARFLERPKVHVPGVELVVEAEVSPATDPYLEDHVFAGERLLPAVLGLEAMAQAARALCPGRDPGSDGGTERFRTVFEEVELSRPIAVPADGRTVLRIAALREASGTCRVALRSSETGFRVDHFRARCNFEPPPPAPDEAELPAAELLDLDPDRELYGGLLFHRGRFRRLGGYRRLTARQCDAEIAPAPAAAGWFGRHLPPRLLLGDPAARDAALHALQASIPHATVLPLAVERLEIGVLDPDEHYQVEAREVRAEPGRLVWDLAVRAGDGRVVERWHGLTLALVDDAPAPEAWPPALLGPLLERRAVELAGTSPGTVLLQRTGAPTAPGTSERRAAGDRALAALLGEASGQPLRRGDGRPDPVAGRRVSLAYAAAASGTLVLAAAGSGAVGCDLEPVVPRDPETWRDLLGAARWELARAVAREVGEAVDHAATRVWSAGEALLKAGLPSDAPLVVEPPRGGWVALRSGDLSVATCIVPVAGEDRPVAVALVCPPSTTPPDDAPWGEAGPQAYPGPNDSPPPASSPEPEPAGLTRPARS